MANITPWYRRKATGEEEHPTPRPKVVSLKKYRRWRKVRTVLEKVRALASECPFEFTMLAMGILAYVVPLIMFLRG